MDNQNILNNIKLYNELLNNKNKVKTIEIGLKFLDCLFDELKEMELRSLDLDNNDVNTLKIYNYKKQSFCILKVNSKLFQQQLQYFYRKFLHEEYYSNFCWYRKYTNSIFKTLENKFKFDSIGAMNLIVSFVSDCFRLFSTGFNEYDFEVMKNHLVKLFCAAKFDSDSANEFSLNILQGLFEDKLLLTNSSFFNFKSKFKLSDRNMDIVFNLNSMFMAHVSSNEIIKYNPKFSLENLDNLIKTFDINYKNRISISNLNSFMLSEYPELTKELYDYYILDLNPDFFKKAPEHLLNSISAFYFYKIFLNEYILQLVIVSCFDAFFLNKGLKNILYTNNLSTFFNT